jgi:hypothetical protein
MVRFHGGTNAPGSPKTDQHLATDLVLARAGVVFVGRPSASHGAPFMIRASELSRRITRLEQLLRGLSREILLWRKGNDPLLYIERQAYLEAIQTALSGVEDARVVLTRVRLRLESEGEITPE